MRELVYTKRFLRSLKKYLDRHPDAEEKITAILTILIQNPFAPALETHELKGKLQGLYACTIAYDLRLIFSFDRRKPPELAAIILQDIGSHDQVYR